MSRYLESTSSYATRLQFVESGGAPGGRPQRLIAFFRAAFRCVGPNGGESIWVLQLSSGGSTWRKVILSGLLSLRRRPYVLHLHGGRYPKFVDTQLKPMQMLIREMFSRAAQVIVLGQGWARFVQERLGVPTEGISVLPNAVPGPSHVPERTGPVRVLLAGRIGARKGAPQLLDAWSRISAGREAVLVLAGDLDDPDGSISAAIERSERVEATGWLDPAGLEAELRRAEILVLPSSAENLPLSLLEGMAWGLAPVVTPVGAVPEVVADGENGRLVPVGDSSALADALSSLIDDDVERHRLGRAARASWEASYSMDGYRERFDDILEEALSSRQRVEKGRR